MTRDMNYRTFLAAIKRHGWSITLLWITGTGKDGHTTGVGMVMRTRGRRTRIDRRATLAKCLRQLESRVI
jgi:hypothetical protein